MASIGIISWAGKFWRILLSSILFINCSNLNNMDENKNNLCDAEGVCKAPEFKTSITDEKAEPLKTIEVIYGYDALCGWCYGFSNDLKIAIDSLEAKVNFKLINGGIFSGDRGLEMRYISKHIKQNAPNVTRLSGVEFGGEFKKLLEIDHFLYDSKKASIAVLILREMKPEKVFEFASAIQKEFFYYGKNIQKDEVYLNLIEAYNIDKKEFLNRLNSKLYAVKIEKEFLEASKLGFSGYPASVIKVNGETHIVNQGYMTADNYITTILNKIKNSNSISTQ